MRVLLHIGAHRTATSHLQSALERSETAFTPVDRDGVMDPGRVALRADICLRHRPWRRPGLRRRFARLSPDRLTVVSDENVVGTMAALFHGNFYEDCAGRVRNLLANTGLGASRLFLSVRSYADFFDSAYAFQTGRALLPEDAKQTLLGLKRGWPEVVADLRATGIPVTVWRHETFDLRSRLADLGVDDVEAGQQVNGTPSRDAMVHLKALRDRGPLTLGQLHYLRDAFPGERYTLWTPEERAMWDARYRHDCQRLALP